jgi:hypothetical protein
MNKGMVLFVLSALCVGACNVEHYDDECSWDDDFEVDDDFETGHRAGSTSAWWAGAPNDDTGKGGSDSGGSTSTTGGAGDSTDDGGTSAAGAPEPMLPPVTPCDKERDCDAGFNCNYDVHECQAANAETCGEMESEQECADRTDCIAVYGGINCSCGADCECQGGEPGCICESFDYLVCQAAE